MMNVRVNLLITLLMLSLISSVAILSDRTMIPPWTICVAIAMQFVSIYYLVQEMVMAEMKE